MTKHTYLLKALDWEATGAYYDENGGRYKLRGVRKIRREGTRCTIAGFMEVALPKPAKFYWDYIFEIANGESLPWESRDAALGVFRGSFVFVGDSIISSYISDDGTYSGTEIFIMEKENRYKNVGVSFKNKMKLSSWSVMLETI